MKILWFVDGMDLDDMKRLAEKCDELATKLKETRDENKRKDKEIERLQKKLDLEKKEKEKAKEIARRFETIRETMQEKIDQLNKLSQELQVELHKQTNAKQERMIKCIEVWKGRDE